MYHAGQSLAAVKCEMWTFLSFRVALKAIVTLDFLAVALILDTATILAPAKLCSVHFSVLYLIFIAIMFCILDFL